MKTRTLLTTPTTKPDRPRREMPWGELPRGSHTFDGLVVVDKNAGVTSHDIVGAMRRLAATRKVGHAGTLDPMATGVLCVGVGRATKLLQYVTGTSKEYRATIRLGIETTTEDAEGDVVAHRGISSLGDESDWDTLIEQAIMPLRGDIAQVPSAVSAIKVDGKRSYDRVRSGETVELEARPVTIIRFDVVDTPRVSMAGDIPVLDVDVVVECSAGTYIRALARDLGNTLGTGAHLTALRRTRVGVWSEDRALAVADLAEIIARDQELPYVGMAELCRGLFTVLDVSDAEAELLRHGQFIESRRVSDVETARQAPGLGGGEARASTHLAVAFQGDIPVALVSRRGGKIKPDLLLTAQ